jgi:hypothetical protein
MGLPERAPLERTGGRRAAVVAAAIYLGLALWAMRAILPAPASTFPFPVRFERSQWMRIGQNDQKLTAALIAHNAHSLVHAPWRIFDSGLCYPAANALALGEHMIGDGLLGIVPYALTGDPILTFNVVLVLTLWLPALAMYALVYFWTRSAGAAFVAGILFGLHPVRVGDPLHPYVHGNYSAVLALLFAHRLFTRQRWLDAGGLALFIGLQVLESMYPLLAFAIIGSTYGLYLTLRNLRRLPSLAPKLLVVAAAAAAVATAVLGPYLEMRATWGTLSGRSTVLYRPQDFALGGSAYPGSVLLLLAAVGILDRLRGARRDAGYDPRFVYLTAGLLVVWASVRGISLPLVGWRVPSLFLLAGGIVPGLDALRGGGAIGFGAVLVSAFLAGYGVLALIEARRAIARYTITAALAAAALGEVFYRPLATYSFGGVVAMAAYGVRPPAPLIEIYGKTAEGAVLDLPLAFNPGRFSEQADYVFLSAFHHRPVAACYNSFTLPIQDEVQALAKLVPKDRRATDALYALGFRTIAVDKLRAWRPQSGFLQLEPDPPRLVSLGTAGLHTVYRLESTTPVEASFAALATTVAVPGALIATPPEATVPFTFRNASAATYRHPLPIEPTALVLRWRGASGDVVGDYRTRALLPLALASGDEVVRSLTVPVPAAAAGAYRVTLAPAATPELVVAERAVRVRFPDSPGGPLP